MIAEWRWFSVKTLPIAELQEEHFTFFPWFELQSSHIIQKVTMQRVSAAISSVFKVHCFTVLCSPYWSLIKHTYIKLFFTDFFTLFFFTDVQTALLTGFLPKLSKDKCHYTSCALQRFDMKFSNSQEPFLIAMCRASEGKSPHTLHPLHIFPFYLSWRSIQHPFWSVCVKLFLSFFLTFILLLPLIV